MGRQWNAGAWVCGWQWRPWCQEPEVEWRLGCIGFHHPQTSALSQSFSHLLLFLYHHHMTFQTRSFSSCYDTPCYCFVTCKVLIYIIVVSIAVVLYFVIADNYKKICSFVVSMTAKTKMPRPQLWFRTQVVTDKRRHLFVCNVSLDFSSLVLLLFFPLRLRFLMVIGVGLVLWYE